MRRRTHLTRVLLALAGTVLGTVLLLGGRQLTAPDPRAPTVSVGQPGGGTGADTAAAFTVTGPVVDTRWGPVQVRITVAGGRITDATAVLTPSSHRRSVAINGRAAPLLRQEALTAQSAAVDVVSGATITSEAYAESLQAALDSAAAGHRD
ncbi:FMN-binding protein [Longispora sp. K20-0274]|uniref:FMN-binding protein n=1 Tax=Longispora sp. K20-0274 TaxID=3088255 RepID=UPI00399BBAE3